MEHIMQTQVIQDEQRRAAEDYRRNRPFGAPTRRRRRRLLRLGR